MAIPCWSDELEAEVRGSSPENTGWLVGMVVGVSGRWVKRSWTCCCRDVQLFPNDEAESSV